MSGIKELSVDQMAVLALVLRQGRPFRELAGMLDMDEGEMRRRAHEALDALGPDDDAGLAADRRAEVSDYLLGQQSDEQRAATYRFLEGSAPGRAWVRVVSDQLGELASDGLPAIPDGTRATTEPATVAGTAAPRADDAAATAAPAPVASAAVTPETSPAAAAAAASAPDTAPAAADGAAAAFGAAPDRGERRSSRRGGALLLGGLALVAVAVALFFVLRSGGDGGGSSTATPAASTTAAQPKAQVVAQVNLVPPSSRKSLKALGVVLVQKSGGRDQIVAAVQGLSKPNSGGYGIWLYSGPGKAQWLGFFASQDSQGRLLARGQLQASIAQYREVLVTRELKGNPPRPGPIFLRGPIQTAATGSGTTNGSSGG
ncbi:MAG: hypothetical protein QOH72_1519 [Solirubrobacteraceae bacterium]|jgi:hypothetical protein|nr:hypothetical protein [Solirubrobacteraceae bacterium]